MTDLNELNKEKRDRPHKLNDSRVDFAICHLPSDFETTGNIWGSLGLCDFRV